MALISTALCSNYFLPSFSLSHTPLEKGLRRNKNSMIFCCKKDGVDQKIVRFGAETGTRRELLFKTVSSALIFPGLALAADTDTDTDTDTDLSSDVFRVYTDEVNKFRIEIPQDWQVGSGEGDGVRSLIAFYPQEPSTSNVSVLITGLGADFTRLESFGKVDAFAENLVSGLDRSWQKPPGVAAKLIDSKAANGLYYIEYTLKNPGESTRHLFSVLGMANNGFYNRLYTLTGQFVDEEERKYGSKILKAVSSFRLT